MQISLAQPIESRNGQPYSDSHILNGIVQSYGQKKKTTKRPALALYHQFTANYGQGMFSMGGKDYAIIGNAINLCQSPYTSYAIPSGPVGGEVFDIVTSPPYIATPLAVLKTTGGMWTFDGTTVTKVTSASYPSTTVRGLALLDGTYYVLTPDGKIYGSAITDPTTWSSTNVVTVNAPQGQSVAIALNNTNVAVFGQNWVSQYYDAQYPSPASPLGFNQSASHAIGCASAASVVNVSDFVVFMAQTEHGRSIRMLVGGQVTPISTEDVNRILDNDALTTVYAFPLTIDGKTLYILSLGASGITLVYDFTEKMWTYWASAAQYAAVATAIIVQNDQATVIFKAQNHGRIVGDVVLIAGATNSLLNGTFAVTPIDANTLSYTLSYNQAVIDQNGNFLVDQNGNNIIATTPPTVGQAAGNTTYSITYYKSMAVNSSTGSNLALDVSDGRVYQFSTNTYADADGYIDFQVVTRLIEGESSDLFRVGAMEVRGDKVATTAYLSYSDDDYTTYSTPQPVNMAATRAQSVRGGASRSRAFKFRHVDNTFCRVDELLVDIS